MNYPKAKSLVNDKALSDFRGKNLGKESTTRLNSQGSANSSLKLRKPSTK